MGENSNIGTDFLCGWVQFDDGSGCGVGVIENLKRIYLT
mgnify:CR=1 FL=1